MRIIYNKWRLQHQHKCNWEDNNMVNLRGTTCHRQLEIWEDKQQVKTAQLQ